MIVNTDMKIASHFIGDEKFRTIADFITRLGDGTILFSNRQGRNIESKLDKGSCFYFTLPKPECQAV